MTKDKTFDIDWRALCKDLLNELESLPCETNYRGQNRSIFPVDEELLYRARESLAQPEPKVEKIGLDVIREAIEERDEFEQRYYDLAQNMVYEGNSVAHWCNKARAYKGTVSRVWEELKKAGVSPDGRLSCVERVRELAERCSGTKDLNEEEVAKVIYRESYYAFGFDSFPPKWEELGDCLVRQCCRDAARVIMTRWYQN